MYKRLNELNLVIGIFFVLTSFILLGAALFRSELAGKINVYTGFAFLIFGTIMILIKGETDE